MISAPLIEYLKKGIFTLLGLVLAVYLFVILITYTGNDPSWSHISSDMTTINNMGGASGAWLSDLLYSFFGFGAWWLLAFVVYESILIWWNNKPTFWLMRMVAYVFLVLSASALFAQLVALVQQVADPVATGLEGVAGGIIGLELQARLAQLLSQWGSVVFLAVFVVITATFAFNIHWLAIYQKITALSWFGSGIKNKGMAQDKKQSTQKSNASQRNDNDIADKKTSQEVPQHKQLPLELQSAEQASSALASDNSSRFSNVLSEFLTSSGLADSVKASVAAATQAAMSNKNAMSNQNHHEYADTAAVMPNDTINNTVGQTSTSSSASPTMTPVRKVEPSFAWNDANTVDDLLASEPMAYSASSAIDPATNDTGPKSLDETTPVSTVRSANTVEATVAQTAVHDTEDTTQNTDRLADTWLAEHAAGSGSLPTVEQFEAAKPEAVPQTGNIAEPPVQQSIVGPTTAMFNEDVSNGSVNFPPDVTSQSLTQPSNHEAEPVPHSASAVVTETSVPSPAAEVAKSASEVVAPVAEVADMTPTNTPPANPTTAPKADSTVATANVPNANPTASTQSTAAATPTVSFAVPEGDSSNHITDMMPEDDSVESIDTSVMPDISDDAAFSKKSRSMQTAAYRSSLTPIPELSILDKPDPDRKPSYTVAELEKLSELLEIKLQEFNVKAVVANAIPGPVVTRFEVELAAGVKASKVTGISRDLARSLSMASLRVVEVIPGKPYIGIEVPNKQREMVRLIELLNTEKFNDPKAQISMAMGKDIGGNPIITDLARAPHMLVAGTTGSGKSVLVNSMLLSMLLKYTPNELRLILIDPKQLELANYNDIPHLLTPVVTDMTEAASSLSWCVAEMERRYQLMSLLKVRKLNEFNKKVIAAEQSGNPMLDPLWRPNDSVSVSQAPKLKTLPMIVIVADEFADMIMQVGKQAEELITRLAQKSRAAGIHLMLATQRPSVDVITGLIKANIPVRAALRVNSKVDSRTILDSGGAEDMLGNGDMLFLGPGQIEPDRVHGAYVSDEEVNRVCDAWRERGAPDYIDNMAGNFELSSPGGGSTGSASGEDDDLYNDAVAFIMETRKVSASSIQRKFSIGYNRAARIVDSMEEAGLVSSMGKSGKRELLI